MEPRMEMERTAEIQRRTERKWTTGRRRTIRRLKSGARALLAAAMVCVMTFRPAAAQPGGEEREARLTALFGQMSAETGVRVTTSMILIEHGSFRDVGQENVRIEQGGEVVPVPLSDIRSVEVERHQPVKGMLWGLGAGLLVGSVSGLLVGSFYCDAPRDCTDEERRGALIGGGALGLAGGIGGFLIGKHRVSWQPVFP